MDSQPDADEDIQNELSNVVGCIANIDKEPTLALHNIEGVLQKSISLHNHQKKVVKSNATKVVANNAVVNECHGTFDRTLGALSVPDENYVDEDDLVAGILNVVTENGELKWENLDAFMTDIPFTFTTSFPLCAAIDMNEIFDEIVVENRKKRSAPQIVAQEKKPQNVERIEQRQITANRLNDILKLVKELYKQRDFKAIPLFELVTHPTEFMATCEVLSQISVLANHKLLNVQPDENGTAVVFPATPAETADTTKKNVQEIASITVDDWEMCVKKYNIKKPMIDIPFEED